MAGYRDSADPSQPTYNPVAGWDPFPDTEEGWRDLYDLRWQSYLQYPYGSSFQRREHLFRAFDDSGNEIDQTRRIFRWYSFIADTDQRALAPGRLVLEVAGLRRGQASPILLAGEAVWRRSRVAAQAQRWFTMVTAIGDYWIEAQRQNARPPYQTRLVGYDPRQVIAWYDRVGELERVEIEVQQLDAPIRTAASGLGTVGVYKRVLTRDRIDVYVNGAHQPEQSGPHGLGVVPCVHLQAIPFDQPEHSLPAPAGIERIVARLDSLLTQAGAIGNRFANPTLATFGFRVGRNSDVQRFGRMIDGAPEKGRAEFIEAKTASITQLLEAMREADKHLRDTCPEVLFSSDAAQESAESRSLRGNAFELKMEGMRAGIYGELTRVTGMAVALDANAQLDEEQHGLFRIDAPPVLPRAVKAELEALQLVRTEIRRADYVRHLQRLGLAPAEADPDTYAAEVADEQATRATSFFDGAPAPGAGRMPADTTDMPSGSPGDSPGDSADLPDDGEEDLLDLPDDALEDLEAIAAELERPDPDLDAVRETVTDLIERVRGPAAR